MFSSFFPTSSTNQASTIHASMRSTNLMQPKTHLPNLHSVFPTFLLSAFVFMAVTSHTPCSMVGSLLAPYFPSKNKLFSCRNIIYAHVLLFALTAASIQALGLHVLPDMYELTVGRHPDIINPTITTSTSTIALVALPGLLYKFRRTFLYFVPLFVMESLICWLDGGHRILSTLGLADLAISNIAIHCLWITFLVLDHSI
mmetsp:Transcript_20521/g.29668  ORF Transcript_20521/g.29668 Transcript_20521/m.29668 type:complete len:200 (+) Transcript_20521:142-741(+)